MGIFPRDCDHPTYDSTFYDGYVKFFMFGDSKEQRDGQVRVFNKVGEAWGTLTDVAYVVDFENDVEFMLSATIRCVPGGVYDDKLYTYEQTGYPFLAKLGRAVMAYELKRPKKNKPDLDKFRQAIKG
jgi:hypothetical protein